MAEKNESLSESFKKGLSLILRVHLPFVLYLLYLFGIVLSALSTINEVIGFQTAGLMILLVLIIFPGILVAYLAYLGAKYKHY